MKYFIKLSVVLVALLALFGSCKKNNEWTNFYGYSKADILGSYSYSQNDNSFEFLTEGRYCHICKDATINITENEDGIVAFVIDCPNANFHHTFSGTVEAQSEAFLLEFVDSNYFVSSSVQKNEKGDILLHGHVRKRIVEIIDEVQVESFINYYFDVIKN